MNLKTLLTRSPLASVTLIELAPQGRKRYLLACQQRRGAEDEAARAEAEDLVQKISRFVSDEGDRDLALVIPPGVGFTFDRMV